MNRNYVRVPAHLLQKPPKKLAPAVPSPFKVRLSNRCVRRITEAPSLSRVSPRFRSLFPFPAVQEYAIRKLARSKLSESKSKLWWSPWEGAFWPPQQVEVVFVQSPAGRRRTRRRANGQLGSADSGIRPGAPGRNRVDNRHHYAPVEDVRLCRGQHHHRGSLVRGTVDVVRLPEHRTDPV